jgi:hypothetical protein
MSTCSWPDGVCQCAKTQWGKEDPYGRVWMHCEEGLTMTKASMSRFIMFCLENNIEIGQIWPFNYRYKGTLVSVTVRLREDQFKDFEKVTKGKLREPPKINLN